MGEIIEDREVSVFKALAHPVRLEIIKRLGESETCVCNIVQWFELDRTSISKHLALMKNCGLLYDRREGKNIYYGIALPCVLTMIRCLDNSSMGKSCKCQKTGR